MYSLLNFGIFGLVVIGLVLLSQITINISKLDKKLSLEIKELQIRMKTMEKRQDKTEERWK